MKKKDIFIGSVMRCENLHINTAFIWEENGCFIKYQGLKIKSNALLLKLSNGYYIDIDNINSFKLLGQKICFKLGKFSKYVLPITPYDKRCLYVDRSSLVNYYENGKEENVSLGKVKKKKLMDPRIPNHCLDH